MFRLLVLGLVFTLWSLAAAAPTNNTAEKKGIVFPKKDKVNATEKPEEPLTNPLRSTTVSHSTVSYTEVTSESTPYSPTDVTPTVEEYVHAESGVSTEQEKIPLVQHKTEEPESDPYEVYPQEPVDSSEVLPGSPLPPDANDGLIEYNLGNPLALKLHLPWWPLKDMLRSIQDAISVMNLTMSGETSEAENTKTKIVQFDNRNYTLKVRVFKPHENNRLLVRLISLTPVIEEGKLPAEKGVKMEDEEINEALQESEAEHFSQMKKISDEKDDEEEDDDDDDDDKDKKEEKKKAKDSKKEKQSKKKKEEKKGSDSESKSD